MTVFIQKGDTPMSYRQAVKRGLRHFEAEKAYWQREQGIVESDPAYLAWAAQWVADNAVNEANNLFNHQLAAYRNALERLARYRLADGRPEVTNEQQAIDEQGQPVLDGETGEPVMETVVVQTAIDPLPATIEQPVYDPETGEQFYQAEGGYLICVANFADALLDIREVSSADDSARTYEAWTEHIPPEGTPVLLELVPIRDDRR